VPLLSSCFIFYVLFGITGNRFIDNCQIVVDWQFSAYFICIRDFGVIILYRFDEYL
jgi:hypothetical protein